MTKQHARLQIGPTDARPGDMVMIVTGQRARFPCKNPNSYEFDKWLFVEGEALLCVAVTDFIRKIDGEVDRWVLCEKNGAFGWFFGDLIKRVDS